MRRTTLGVLLWLGLLGCSEPIEFPTRVVHRAVDIALTCTLADGTPAPVQGCAGRMRVWIGDADVGGLSVMDASSGSHTDADPFVPGFTSVAVGDDIVSVAAAPDSSGVYALLRGPKEVARVDPSTLGVTRQPIPCRAEAMEVAAAGPLAGSLVLACSEPPALVSVPFAGFSTLPAAGLPMFPVAGRPRHLAVSGDGTAAYVTHTTVPGGDPARSARNGFLTRVDLATGVAEHVSLLAACSDGLDGDGDGLVDAADPGCDGPGDEVEEPDTPGPCENGVDDDGDGQADAGDPDCPLAETALDPLPACANGVDDDGDGAIDAGADADCYGPLWPIEADEPARVAGRPAVSPDGRFVYVPLSAPAGVAVFRASPLARVDVNAPDAPVPNVLLARTGFRDILVNAGATDVVMTTASTGSRALVALASGQVVELVVDDSGSEQHRPAAVPDATVKPRSAATAPELRVGGVALDTGASLHPEHASFGPSVVSLVPGGGDRYSYFGIVFNGDPSLELTETWRVTYEGRIPGTGSPWGFFLGDGRLLDPTASFCDAGVEPGDMVVVVGPEGCGDLGGRRLEYRVVAVSATALEIEAAPGGLPLPDPACTAGGVDYEVRVSDAWTVVGSRSGFLHNQTTGDGGACITRADADPRFNGRAYTSLPPDGTTLSACPPLPDAPDVAWRDFRNIAFSFRLFPPCETDEQFQSRVLPETRDAELRFEVLSGQVPRAVSIGGVPVGMTVAGDNLYVFDAGGGFLAVVDVDAMTVRSTYY